MERLDVFWGIPDRKVLQSHSVKEEKCTILSQNYTLNGVIVKGVK